MYRYRRTQTVRQIQTQQKHIMRARLLHAQVVRRATWACDSLSAHTRARTQSGSQTQTMRGAGNNIDDRRCCACAVVRTTVHIPGTIVGAHMMSDWMS